MPRGDFQRQMTALQDELLRLGGMVQNAITKSVDGLRRRDLAASREVVQEDDAIDELRYRIEDACVHLIAQQQPMAGDLRVIVAILHICNELERMGDYAEGIAKISIRMGEEPPLKPLIDIPRMATMASDMLRRALDTLVQRDVEAARRVIEADDEVDALYDQVYRELIFFMVSDPKTITRATYLLWVAHDLERVADRATNVAERVIYLVTGKYVEGKLSTL